MNIKFPFLNNVCPKVYLISSPFKVNIHSLYKVQYKNKNIQPACLSIYIVYLATPWHFSMRSVFNFCHCRIPSLYFPVSYNWKVQDNGNIDLRCGNDTSTIFKRATIKTIATKHIINNVNISIQGICNRSTLNNKLLFGSIFCDLQKAFDCVNYDILLSEMEFYGISVKVNNLIKSL
jgi:hypothetical protein